MSFTLKNKNQEIWIHKPGDTDDDISVRWYDTKYIYAHVLWLVFVWSIAHGVKSIYKENFSEPIETMELNYV